MYFKEQMRHLLIGEVTVDNDEIYGSNYWFNGVYKFCVNDTERAFQYIGSFEGEKLQEINLYRHVVKHGKYLVFTDTYAKAKYMVSIWDLESEEQKYYIENDEKLPVCGCWVRNEKVYILLADKWEYYVIDINSGTVNRKEVVLTSGEREKSYRTRGIIYNEDFYVISYNYDANDKLCQTNKILKMNTMTCRAEVISIGTELNQIRDIFEGRDGICTLDSERAIITEMTKDGIREICVPKELAESLFRGVYCNDKLFLFTNGCAGVGVYDYHREEFRLIPFQMKKKNPVVESIVFSEALTIGNYVFALPYGYGKMLIVDSVEETVDYIDATVEDKVIRIVEKEHISGIHNETDGDVPFRDWIRILAQ